MPRINEKLTEVCEKFRIKGRPVNFETIKRGHINETYRVILDTGKSHIVQKVNTYVFKSPEKIMENIDLITTHIRNKYPDRVSLHFHHTENGDNFYYDDDRSFWRLTNDIDSVSYDVSDDLRLLGGAGRAFGEFQVLLSDFDAGRLHETIEGFHNTPKRIDDFLMAVRADEHNKAAGVEREIDFVRSAMPLARALSQMLEGGEIPLRVTHNDTKINNVLFDKNGEPLVVIDLDTVMPGLSAHDFGDAVRSAASTTDEDERNLSKVALDLDKFTAFAKGFVCATAGALTPAEIKSMPLGAYTMAVELGTRFLHDYINGNAYFKVNYERHNLDRARCQFKLARDIESKFEIMGRIIDSVAEGTGTTLWSFPRGKPGDGDHSSRGWHLQKD